MAEDPRKPFERYVRRLPERLAVATDTEWEKLQGRANEKLLGAHVGKLEFFWIHSPGYVAVSEESVYGLVCFQFVQGFASNFARILHLSVVDNTIPGEAWSSALPSALLEVRRLLFQTLPVDNIRAIVLAAEDDTGRIYVDKDVEISFQRCGFRWFQLTQKVHRTRSAVSRRVKVKAASRFLVLTASRDESRDPKPPRESIGRLPAALLRSEERSSDVPVAEVAEDADSLRSFSNF
jgi:hypothetical protein